MTTRMFNGSVLTFNGSPAARLAGISYKSGGAKVDVSQPADLNKLFEIAGGLAGEAQGAFEALLYGLYNSFYFSFAQARQLHPIATIGQKYFASPTPTIRSVAGSTKCCAASTVGATIGSRSIMTPDG